MIHLLVNATVHTLDVAGKRADFLVLADDPLACRPEAIRDVRVLQTWVGGLPIVVRP